MAIYDNEQKISVKHKLPGFFIVYLLSTLPGVITGFLVSLLVLFFIGVGITGALRGDTSNAGQEPLILQTISQRGNSQDKILIYNLNGVIQSGGRDLPVTAQNQGVYTDIVKRDFARIKNDKTIKTVVFKVNSPGGEVFASQELGDEINKLIKDKNIPQATFFFDQIAASGALLAAYKVPNYVVASPYGETGSIGVRLELPNVQKLADNIGYKSIVIKSGPSKDIGSIFRDPTSEEVKYFQSQVDETYKQFVDIVAQGRGIDAAKVRTFANGLTYFNNQAKDFGLVNEIGDLDRSITHAAEKSNLGDYRVVEIQPQTSLINSLTAAADLPSLLGLSHKAVDSLNQLAELENGKMYMLDERRF